MADRPQNRPIGDVVRARLTDPEVADGLSNLRMAVELIDAGGLEDEDPVFRAVWEARDTLRRLGRALDRLPADG